MFILLFLPPTLQEQIDYVGLLIKIFVGVCNVCDYLHPTIMKWNGKNPRTPDNISEDLKMIMITIICNCQ